MGILWGVQGWPSFLAVLPRGGGAGNIPKAKAPSMKHDRMQQCEFWIQNLILFSEVSLIHPGVGNDSLFQTSRNRI